MELVIGWYILKKDDGAYCKYCVLFAGEGGGVGKQTFGNLKRNHLKTGKMILKYLIIIQIVNIIRLVF